MGETANRGDQTTSEDPVTVEELNGWTFDLIDSSELLHRVRCVGEITNVSESNAALYFTLTDGEHELSCVIWESRNQRLAVDIEDGMEVVIEGNVDYWGYGEKISLKPWQVSEVGKSEQAAALNRLEQELEKRGWFDDDRKHWSLEFPGRIGVVTSIYSGDNIDRRWLWRI